MDIKLCSKTPRTPRLRNPECILQCVSPSVRVAHPAVPIGFSPLGARCGANVVSSVDEHTTAGADLLAGGAAGVGAFIAGVGTGAGFGAGVVATAGAGVASAGDGCKYEIGMEGGSEALGGVWPSVQLEIGVQCALYGAKHIDKAMRGYCYNKPSNPKSRKKAHPGFQPPKKHCAKNPRRQCTALPLVLASTTLFTVTSNGDTRTVESAKLAAMAMIASVSKDGSLHHRFISYFSRIWESNFLG